MRAYCLSIIFFRLITFIVVIASMMKFDYCLRLYYVAVRVAVRWE